MNFNHFPKSVMRPDKETGSAGPEHIPHTSPDMRMEDCFSPGHLTAFGIKWQTATKIINLITNINRGRHATVGSFLNEYSSTKALMYPGSGIGKAIMHHLIRVFNSTGLPFEASDFLAGGSRPRQRENLKVETTQEVTPKDWERILYAEIIQPNLQEALLRIKNAGKEGVSGTYLSPSLHTQINKELKRRNEPFRVRATAKRSTLWTDRHFTLRHVS